MNSKDYKAWLVCQICKQS